MWEPFLSEHGRVLLVFWIFWELCGACEEAAHGWRAVGPWRDQVHGIQRQGQDESSRFLCGKGVQCVEVTELSSSWGTGQDLSCHPQGLGSSLLPLCSNHLPSTGRRKVL